MRKRCGEEGGTIQGTGKEKSVERAGLRSFGSSRFRQLLTQTETDRRIRKGCGEDGGTAQGTRRKCGRSPAGGRRGAQHKQGQQRKKGGREEEG